MQTGFKETHEFPQQLLIKTQLQCLIELEENFPKSSLDPVAALHHPVTR